MPRSVSAADGALKAGATAVSQARVEMDGQLKSLEGSLSGIGSSWQGDGAAAFQAVMARWREDSTKLIGALSEFEAKLLSSQTRYTQADDAQSNIMNKLLHRCG